MIVDICYKLIHFDSKKDEKLCFICATRAAILLADNSGRIKLKSVKKPAKCDRCGDFIPDTIDTGFPW
jgi:hypothetical protein